LAIPRPSGCDGKNEGMGEKEGERRDGKGKKKKGGAEGSALRILP